MNINLIVYDMEIFLDKYTKFMTKDIYISNKMYFKFLHQYSYLFHKLEEDKFLYDDNNHYKKIIEIFTNKMGLLKLHNQKYLKRALKKHHLFFEGLLLRERLDTRRKMIVLAEEESIYIAEYRHYESLVVGKIKYLIDYKKYLNDNILVLTSNELETNNIRKTLSTNGINISVLTIKEYENKCFSSNCLLDDDKRYNFIINYIINDLFIDKVKFEAFYKAFSKYIYLNKDYRDYDTFKDYHNYMYKRKFLASNLSLKGFNEKEIKGRKSYLRTIKNESLRYKEEVDIANFLYLNSISYIYDADKLSFKLLDREIYIKYINEMERIEENSECVGNVISLYFKYKENKNYLEVLAYELIKRMVPLELVSDEELYAKLSSTNIENYFSEFVNKYLVPLINYYEENGELDFVNMNDYSKKEFLKLYRVYNDYLKVNDLITVKESFSKIEKSIVRDGYKYLFLVGDIPLKCNIPTFTIGSLYKKTELIKENIKLLYDYKEYLYKNQTIPILHTYLDKKEIDLLTKYFLRDNLAIINKLLENTVKDIRVYEYKDNNRLHVYRNISDGCYSIFNSQNQEVLFAFRYLKDINILVSSNKFTKLNSNSLLTRDGQVIFVEEILKIDKIYDTIVLPYLIKDSYHDDLFKDECQYNLKIMLYVALNRCRNNLVILCPSSKIRDIETLFKNLKFQVISC